MKKVFQSFAKFTGFLDKDQVSLILTWTNYLSIGLAVLPKKYLKKPYICCDSHKMFQTETVARRCYAKDVLLKILQSAQEDSCAGVSFLTKLQAQCSSTGIFP